MLCCMYQNHLESGCYKMNTREIKQNFGEAALIALTYAMTQSAFSDHTPCDIVFLSHQTGIPTAAIEIVLAGVATGTAADTLMRSKRPY